MIHVFYDIACQMNLNHIEVTEKNLQLIFGERLCRFSLWDFSNLLTMTPNNHVAFRLNSTTGILPQT